MTKYEDFKGEVTVDFEGNTSEKSKLKEFFNVELHDKDIIIGIKFSVGEYHHHRKNEPYKSLSFDVINQKDLTKSEEDRKIKKIEVVCDNFEQFFAFFKRFELDLKPNRQKFSS